MTQPIDAKDASIEIARYIRAVLKPPTGGASVGDILGAYIFKAILRDAGYTIVPLQADERMRGAFRRGWIRPFQSRYEALLKAVWPEPDPPQG